jgi:hypothetical protein
MGRLAASALACKCGSTYVAIVFGPHWPSDVPCKHARPECGQQDGRWRCANAESGMGCYLLAIDISLLASQQWFKAVDELTCKRIRTVPSQAHPTLCLLSGTSTDSKCEATLKSRLRTHRQLRQRDRMSAVQRHHRGAKFGQPWRISGNAGKRHNWVDPQRVGNPQAVKTGRIGESRRFACLVDRRQHASRRQPPPHTESIVAHAHYPYVRIIIRGFTKRRRR